MSNTLRKSTFTAGVLLSMVALVAVALFTSGGNTQVSAANAGDLSAFDYKLKDLPCGKAGESSCTQATLTVAQKYSNLGKTASQLSANNAIETTGNTVTYTEGGTTGQKITFGGVGSNALYATVSQRDDSGNPTNLIAEGADHIIVEVTDADALTLTTIEEDVVVSVSAPRTLEITDPNKLPIVDTDNDGFFTDQIQVSDTTDQVQVISVTPGNPDNPTGEPGLIRFACTTAAGLDTNCAGATDDTDTTAGASDKTVKVSWPTSDVNSSVVIEVKSSRIADPVYAVLKEATRGSAKFTGVIQILDADNQALVTGVENQKTGTVPAVTGATCDQNNQATNACADVDGTANITQIAAVGGSNVTVSYRDKINVNTADNSPVTNTLSVDVAIEANAPSVAVSSPADGSFATDTTPDFIGTASDSGSGLDITSLHLVIDNADDANNAGLAYQAFVTAINDGRVPVAQLTQKGSDNPVAEKLIASGSDSFSATTERDHYIYGATDAGYLDGRESVSFSYSVKNSDELLSGVTNIDHIVDYGLYVSDMAGNVFVTDANSDTAGYQGFTYNIDKTLPAIIPTDATGTNVEPWTSGTVTPATDIQINGNSRTGVSWDSTNNEFVVNRKIIMVLFNDKVVDVEATDFSVTFGAGQTTPAIERVFTVTPPAPTVFTNNGDDLVDLLKRAVFVELDTNVPSSIKPIVSVSGVTDESGNTIEPNSSVTAQDGLGPEVTVSVVSPTDNSPLTLTNGPAKIVVSADEGSGRPTVRYYRDNVQVTSVQANSSGAGEWSHTTSAGTITNPGLVCVVVTVTDGVNSTTAGTSDCANATGSNKISYTLDTSSPISTLNGVAAGGEITVFTFEPLLRAQFAGETDVTITKLEIDDVDHLADLGSNTAGSADYSFLLNKVFTVGSFKVEIQGKDAAGNESSVATYTLKVEERSKFSFSINAGWNAISVPSDPINKNINSVFTNSQVTRVLSYDASQFRNPWKTASRSGSGSFAGTLTEITSGPGYWVFSTGFVNQEVALEGPIAPTNANIQITPVTISAGVGWNFVGVVDPTRVSTTGNAGALTGVTVSSYFSSVDATRVYRWDAAAGTFAQLNLGSVLNTGEAIWAYINPNNNGTRPVIIP